MVSGRVRGRGVVFADVHSRSPGPVPSARAHRNVSGCLAGRHQHAKRHPQPGSTVMKRGIVAFVIAAPNSPAGGPSRACRRIQWQA